MVAELFIEGLFRPSYYFVFTQNNPVFLRNFLSTLYFKLYNNYSVYTNNYVLQYCLYRIFCNNIYCGNSLTVCVLANGIEVSCGN